MASYEASSEFQGTQVHMGFETLRVENDYQVFSPWISSFSKWP